MSTVLNLVAEISLALVAAVGLSAMMSPRLRVLIYRCVFAVAIAAPLTLAGGLPKAPLIEVALNQDETFAPREGAIRHVAAQVSRAAELPGRAVDPRLVLAALWLGGALLAFGRYLASARLLGRAFQLGKEGPHERLTALKRRLGVTADIEVRVSPLVAGPCAFGIARPRILLPAQSYGLETLDAVLAHELCHVRQRDALWLMAGSLASAIHWFNPLVWLIAARHRDEIEIVCDESALASVGGIEAYTTALLEAARQFSGAREAGATMGSRGVAVRIRRLIEREKNMPHLTLLGRTAAISAAAAMLALFATTDLVAARSTDPAIAAVMEEDAPAVQNGSGVLHLNVGPGVTVRARRIGFLCSDAAQCEASMAPNTDLVLSSQTPVHWTGCTPAADGLTCHIHIPDGTVRVDVSPG